MGLIEYRKSSDGETALTDFTIIEDQINSVAGLTTGDKIPSDKIPKHEGDINFANNKKDDKPTVILVLGMAGSGKTTFVHRLFFYLRSRSRGVYTINLDPAVKNVPYPVNIDIRETVKYKEVMKKFGLGPNGAIMTCLNLFTTRFNSVISEIEREISLSLSSSDEQNVDKGTKLEISNECINEKKESLPRGRIDYILVDTPGQLEVFNWSASGTIITEAFSLEYPVVQIFVVDGIRCYDSPNTFMSNMLYSTSILFKTHLPMICVFNKCDVECTNLERGLIRSEGKRNYTAGNKSTDPEIANNEDHDFRLLEQDKDEVNIKLSPSLSTTPAIVDDVLIDINEINGNGNVSDHTPEFPHSRLYDWQTNFDSFISSLSEENSANTLNRGYITSLLTSLAINMSEFYETINVAHVSSLFGQGFPRLHEKILLAREEYVEQYLPYMQERKEKILCDRQNMAREILKEKELFGTGKGGKIADSEIQIQTQTDNGIMSRIDRKEIKTNLHLHDDPRTIEDGSDDDTDDALQLLEFRKLLSRKKSRDALLVDIPKE